MKNKREIIITIFLLLILLLISSLLFRKPLKALITASINPATPPAIEKNVDYFNINDDDMILKNGHCSQPDNRDQKLIPVGLKKYLVNDYYPTHSYTYPDIKINYDCPLENSKFLSVEADLNEDGKKEYILMPYRICDTIMRGASGNGDILIVRNINGDLEVFGSLYGNDYFISKNKTNGYFDILTKSHGSYATGTETLYKYQTYANGRESNNYEEAFSKWYDLSRVEKSNGKSN